GDATLFYANDKSRKISVSDRLFEAARSGFEQDQREDQCCRRIGETTRSRGAARQARAERLAGPSMASCLIRAQRGKESGSKPGTARTRLDAIGTAGELLRYFRQEMCIGGGVGGCKRFAAGNGDLPTCCGSRTSPGG